ncbi:MAG: helix-hairpin-helix domain-containing protein [Patescibacteria group bacterium]
MPSGFFKSFQPLLKRLKPKKYLLEIILLSVAIIITVTALVIYVKNGQNAEEEIATSPNSFTRRSFSEGGPIKIFIDVSGAVKKPGLYQVIFGARIKEAIDKAGGLSDEADKNFFARNFNLARIVSDQEKIYVPSVWEVNNNIFMENSRTLDYVSPTTSTGIASNAPTDTNNQLININFATIEELDQLPGIGQITANKIIANRPYSTVDELLTKKVVNKGVFEKIKNLIFL